MSEKADHYNSPLYISARNITTVLCMESASKVTAGNNLFKFFKHASLAILYVVITS